MNAVEALEAAITKLEELKTTATPGIGSEHWVLDCDVHIDGVGNLGRETWPGVIETAELIVTSHRMVEPVLAILYRGLTRVAPEHDSAVMLAESILGES